MSMQTPDLALNSDDAPAPFGTAALLIGAILFGSFIGATAPETGETLSQGVDQTLLVMIFLLFFELRLGSIVKAFSNLKFLVIAWGSNFLLIPAIGFAIASLFFGGQPLLFAGLIIYFLAPCTDWFLGFTRMARGDTKLGAALIPVNMTTQLLFFPLWLWLFTQNTGLVDFGSMPQMLTQWFLLPLVLAQIVRVALERLAPTHLAERVIKIASQCLPIVLAALITQLFAAHIGVLFDNIRMFAMVVIAVLLFFVMTFTFGEIIAQLGRLDYPQRALLSITMAARNAPLMLALTAVAIPNQPLVLAVIVSGMLVEIPLLIALRQLLLWRANRMN